jgi:hypothetical protein
MTTIQESRNAVAALERQREPLAAEVQRLEGRISQDQLRGAPVDPGDTALLSSRRAELNVLDSSLTAVQAEIARLAPGERADKAFVDLQAVEAEAHTWLLDYAEVFNSLEHHALRLKILGLVVPVAKSLTARVRDARNRLLEARGETPSDEPNSVGWAALWRALKVAATPHLFNHVQGVAALAKQEQA